MEELHHAETTLLLILLQVINGKVFEYFWLQISYFSTILGNFMLFQSRFLHRNKDVVHITHFELVSSLLTSPLRSLSTVTLTILTDLTSRPPDLMGFHH